MAPHDEQSSTSQPVHLPPGGEFGAPETAAAAEKRSRIGILRPLKHRDFALLWAGMTISLLGDGIFLVALTFQVYAISNDPTALSLVLGAWTAPMVVFFLFTGVLTDRMDRRLMMIAADVLRGGSVGAMGFLSVSGSLEISHLIVLAAIYGIGDTLFMPAFTAIVPEVVPDEVLVEANSLDQFVRPLTLRMLGPAIGGFLVGAFGAGTALLVDAASFVVSVVAVILMQKRPRKRSGADRTSALSEIKEGLVFVKGQPWLWGTISAAAVFLLAFIGPAEVLLPYLIKNDLGGTASDFGWVLLAGGAGSIVTSFIIGQRGLPKRHMLFLFQAFGFGVLLVAGYPFVNAVWQAAVISFLMAALFTAGMVIWGTLMHKLVPQELMGRVSSIDWLVSTLFVPVSFVLTGPISKAIGITQTMVWGGVLAGGLTFLFLFIPGIRDTEGDPRLANA